MSKLEANTLNFRHKHIQYQRDLGAGGGFESKKECQPPGLCSRVTTRGHRNREAPYGSRISPFGGK